MSTPEKNFLCSNCGLVGFESEKKPVCIFCDIIDKANAMEESAVKLRYAVIEARLNHAVRIGVIKSPE